MKLFYKFIVVLLAVMLVFLAGCSDNEKALVEAVKNGDTPKVQSLLDQGVSPDLKTDDGKSVLMLAAYLGHTDIAKLLIDKGADVNAKDNGGKTALMYAAEKGHIEIARLLLENGADLNAVDNNGKTALQIAQDNNQTEMVEFLSNWGKTAPDPTPAPTETPVPTPEPTKTPVPALVPTKTPVPTIKPTGTPAPTETPVPVASANQQLSSIFFDFNKSALRLDQTETIKDDLAILKEYPEMYIILAGHACERGTREYNQALSGRRAKTIQKYLINNGIDPKRIIVYAFGKDHPLKEGHDEASLSYNRRVDILMWDTRLSTEEVLAETIK